MKHLVSSRLLVPVLPVVAANSYNHFGKLVFIAQPRLSVAFSVFTAVNKTIGKRATADACKTISIKERVSNHSITAKPTRQ